MTAAATRQHWLKHQASEVLLNVGAARAGDLLPADGECKAAAVSTSVYDTLSSLEPTPEPQHCPRVFLDRADLRLVLHALDCALYQA
jgi:hypothetical protein